MGFGNKNSVNVFVLGVAGIIGSGKSVFCRYLRDKFGFHWIPADKITREIYKAGKSGYKSIKKHFGEKFVDKKEVLRQRLREFVLKSPKNLKILNKLVHPLIAQEVNKKIVQIKRANKTKKPILICIEAVYFDPKYLGKFVDYVVFLDAADSQIIKRLRPRKIPEKELRKLIAFQRKNMAK